MHYEEGEERFPVRVRRVSRSAFVGIAMILFLASLLFLAVTMFVQVEVGYVLLINDPITRTVSEVVAVGPSWYFKLPWQTAVPIYYATDTYEDIIPTFSRDQMEMRIQVLIRWSLDPVRTRELYLNYPTLAYKVKAIESIMEETVRLVTKNYTVIETIEYRELVTHRIQEAVLKAVKAEPSLANALIHLELDLKNIDYPAKYTSAIQDKLVAEQMMIQAEFERKRIIVLANASAQGAILEAQGQAQAKIIVADGIKQAIQMIAESAGITNSTRIAELYMYLEALKQIAPEINVLIITTGEGGIPIIYQIP